MAQNVKILRIARLGKKSMILKKKSVQTRINFGKNEI